MSQYVTLSARPGDTKRSPLLRQSSTTLWVDGTSRVQSSLDSSTSSCPENRRLTKPLPSRARQLTFVTLAHAKLRHQTDPRTDPSLKQAGRYCELQASPEYTFFPQKTDRRDFSLFMSTCCSSRGLQFNTHCPHLSLNHL